MATMSGSSGLGQTGDGGSGVSGGADGGRETTRDGTGFVPPGGDGPPTSANDPIERYMAILADPDLSDEQKSWLIQRANRRFRNRRRMAYIALGAVLAMMLVVVAGAVIDGIWDTDIVARLNQAANLLGVTNALLTTIVGAYYGFSSLRPSS
jgi:hypothetical protein